VAPARRRRQGLAQRRVPLTRGIHCRERGPVRDRNLSVRLLDTCFGDGAQNADRVGSGRLVLLRGMA
jgi:hypothetical protein